MNRKILNIKNEVLVRVYIVLLLVVVAAIFIFGKAVQINVQEGERWRAKGDSLYVQYKTVKAERGNILAANGSLLATSLPFFDIRFDPTSMSESIFMENIDSLAHCLAKQVNTTFTEGGYRDELVRKRQEGVKYVKIKDNVSYAELERIRKFPIFNRGWIKGGLIVESKYDRRRPFKSLAERTVGYLRTNAKVGLEGRFNEVLAGEEGKRLMQRVGKGVWIPVNDLTEIEPKRGDDIVTTIDVNLQDVTHNALKRGLEYHDAQYGTAILIEVETGAIRAIANLGKRSVQRQVGWGEIYNYAIGTATEPGSTYKLASIMALLEDGHVELTDSVNLEKGKTTFYKENMADASIHDLEMTDVKTAFSISSNVGISKLVVKHYGSQPEAFIQRLEAMNLHLPVGVEIQGEAPPYMKNPADAGDNWSGTTLPWMSIGYEVTITPLQLLTFYNALANNGREMKPYLVSEIQRNGETVERFRPTVIKRKIASEETINKAKELLEEVVETGTASKLKSSLYRFAAKTGTAQVDYQKTADELGHQASFVGYFPAEKPKYSCIVVINKPKRHGFYGGEVAGPVFREIADKCFAMDQSLFQTLNQELKYQLVSNQLPNMEIGYKQDIMTIFEHVKMPYKDVSVTPWAVVQASSDTLSLLNRIAKKDIVPNVIGMGGRDAIYLLENTGLTVKIEGYGKVVKQSIPSGTIPKGQKVLLTLR